MNNLFVFGCSYTAPYGDIIKNYREYRKFRGGTLPPVWPEILSEKLNLNLFNYGIGGAGNDFIFEEFCEKSDELRKGDTLIIEWSYHTRVNFKFDVENDIYDKIRVGRNQDYYKNQFLKFEKVIDNLCKHIGVNVFYWSGDWDVIYRLPKEKLYNRKYLLCDKVVYNDYEQYTPFTTVFELGGQTIKMETNGLIDDLHFGESGHRIMADLFYDHIINFKKNMI